MKNKRTTLLSLIVFLTITSGIFARNNDLRIFGYYQNNFSYIHTNDTEFMGMPSPGWDTKSFMMQQMNIFFAKNFNPELSSFVNLEWTNSFNFEENRGGFKVEEAWLKYSPTSSFNLKGGLLIPRFNNFNEIKNRTVLLPYIYRPLVYETVFNQQFTTADFVPLQAYLQVYGDLKVNNDVRLNYAAFMGNSTSDNLIGNDFGLATANDSSKSKMFGARIGAEIGDLDIGGSISYDKKNADGFWDMGLKLGEIPRIRFGAYLNYGIAGFEVEAEYIKVTHEVTATQEAKIFSTGFVTPEFTFDKSYFHTNLLYNITDQFYAYGGYDHMEIEDNIFAMGGLDQWTVGGGYRINYAVVLKVQYVNQNSKIFGVSEVTRQDMLVGASVYF